MEEERDHVGHRERLRKRFLQGGDRGLHDYELLELLLTYAIPRRDVKPYAKDLIRKFGSLAGALDAGPRDLEEALHIGPISSTLIHLVKRLCEEYFAEKMINRDALSSPQAVLDFARVKMAGLPHEGFMVIFLNTKNRVLDYRIIQEGTVDRAVIYPRRIIEEAIARHAASVILVHNHPSGHSEPSPEDRELTRSIVEAARTIDLRVLDHVVVGKEGYFSFVENHIFPGGAK
jgi:DNA repair protein RadC